MMWRVWYGEVEEVKYMTVFVCVHWQHAYVERSINPLINHSWHIHTIFLVPPKHEDGKTRL